MKTAIYPGSFNPWHKGHEDILNKALLVFDKVVVLQGHNPEKPGIKDKLFMELPSKYKDVEVGFFTGLLVDVLKDFKFDAVIRGLRSGRDFDNEVNNQYWNEDLGSKTPFVYFICDRNHRHISSTAIRGLNAYEKNK